MNRYRRHNPRITYNLGLPSSGHQFHIGYEHVIGELTRQEIDDIDEAIATEMLHQCYLNGIQYDGWSEERTVSRYVNFHFPDEYELAHAYDISQNINWDAIILNALHPTRQDRVVGFYTPKKLRGRSKKTYLGPSW